MYLAYFIGFGAVIFLIAVLEVLERKSGKKRGLTWFLRIVLFVLLFGGVSALLYFSKAVIGGMWG